MDDRYLTETEAAQYLGVCVRTLYNLKRRGLKHAKINGRANGGTRFRLSWLDAFMDRNSRGDNCAKAKVPQSRSHTGIK